MLNNAEQVIHQYSSSKRMQSKHKTSLLAIDSFCPLPFGLIIQTWHIDCCEPKLLVDKATYDAFGLRLQLQQALILLQ